MKKILLKTFTLLLCALIPLSLNAFCLQDKFAHAEAGDFIVSAQEGNYSLLFIRSITSETLLLEEISIPSHQIDIKKIHWQNFVDANAPGHTSWTLYEIKRASGQLVNCFSYSKNEWLYLDESEQFLTRLLSLKLTPVPDAQRKKIGPPSSSTEEDQRALWNPPLVLEGKKKAKPHFDALRTRWPEDGSRLSSCFIELYFDKEEPNFAFPYWLEVQSPHYSFKMRTIDSGHNLISAKKGPMPHRSPQIMNKSSTTSKSIP